jgi:hypothetical protein
MIKFTHWSIEDAATAAADDDNNDVDGDKFERCYTNL